MSRRLRPIGCFGLSLLLILVALAITETLKHVGALERTIALGAAILVSATVAFLREQWTAPSPALVTAPPAVDRSELLDALRRTAPVERPASNTGDDPILAARQQAILFRQHVPPLDDPRHLSFFGGAPIAPRGFEWPEALDPSGVTKPISFLMQVDCAAIPAAGRVGLFPGRGVLYVFLDSGANACRVLYEPGPSDDWAEVATPVSLGPLYPPRRRRGRPHHEGDAPRLWPKWTFDPVLVQGGPLPEDPEARAATYAWPGTVPVKDAIEAIPGAVVPRASFADDGYDADGHRRRPYDEFPQDWGAIRATTELIEERIELEVLHGRPRAFRDLSDAEWAVIRDAATAELHRWEERAYASPATDQVPPEERERFWGWMMEREWLTRFLVPDAATVAVESSLAAGGAAAARVPGDAVDRIRHRHALAVRTERGLHINKPDRMLAAPSDVQGDIDDRVREYLLLLELSSNEGLGHHFGEGVFQFWIRPADLAARRFDRVELSTTAY